MFRSVLIANRGEIAARIARTCARLGIKTIAVYSDADANALHVRACDDAIYIGESESAQSYLNTEAILYAAKEAGAQAIHPGYGFLSENASFARAVAAAGLTFIGPRPETIEQMGDKVQAKALAAAAKVPTVPGLTLENGKSPSAAELKKIGLPLLIKAAAGGGGRGMRIVRQEGAFAESIAAASRQAQAFFNDGTVFLEKLVENARHIEVQILGQGDGKVYHLGTRDCSMQRNHQKVLEEAPAPFLSDAVRKKLHEYAVSVCSAARYKNAGTVEFLVKDDTIYFLEVNSRLQVEHPVTEMVYGVDLVELQLRIAAGDDISATMANLAEPCGHAIEARVCCESPRKNFQADTGFITDWIMPADAARVDAGFEAGGHIPHYYDSLLAKVITTGAAREEARSALVKALGDVVITGVETNLEFLLTLVSCDEFIGGRHRTSTAEEILARMHESSAPLIALAAAGLFESRATDALGRDSFRLLSCAPQTISGKVNGIEQRAEVCFAGSGTIRIGATEYSYEWISSDALRMSSGRGTHMLRAYRTGGRQWITGDLGSHVVEPWRPALKKEKGQSASGRSVVTSPLPGKVLTMKVAAGETVQDGTVVAVIESMKMEHSIKASGHYTVDTVLCSVGDVVQKDAPLVSLRAPSIDS